jgi:hypothetical protein
MAIAILRSLGARPLAVVGRDAKRRFLVVQRALTT